MKGNLPRALLHIFAIEGGYVDHDADPGGATNLGITIGTLAQWRKRAVTEAELRALSYEEAGLIYEALFWRETKCDELPSGVDLVAFDAAVNSGPSRSVRWLQRAVGTAQDGIIGPKTLAAVKAHVPALIINRACLYRMEYLRDLPHWPTFGDGWTARVDRVRDTAQEMARPTSVEGRLASIEARLMAGGL